MPNEPHYPRDQVLIRFRANQVDLPIGLADAPLSIAYTSTPALRESLASSGVYRLARVFSTFRHTDVTSQNKLGERIILDDLADYYVAYLTQGIDLAPARQCLSRQPAILATAPDYGGRVALSTIPNDPAFPRQWALRDTHQVLCGLTSQGGDIQGPFAWDRSIGDPSVRVAVIDGGIDTTHVDFAGHIRAGASFVPGTATSQDSFPYHGTAVAGILGATGYNALNVAGVAWRPTLWAVKATTAGGFGQSTWLGNAINWTRANHFPVVNMSIGFGEVGCQGYASINPADAALLNATCLNSFYDGAFLVASSGNCDAQVRYYPAAFTRRVFAVGAYFLDGARWEDYNFASHNPPFCPFPTDCQGSSYGPWLDAVAPGGRLIITLGQGPTGTNDIDAACNAQFLSGMAFGGTSAAAPHVAGIAALLISLSPSLLGEDIENILHITAAHSFPNPNNFYGYGYVKAASALAFAGSGTIVMHGTIGNLGTHGALADVDSVRVVRRFNNVPGLPGDGLYTCWRHRMRGYARFSGGFSFNPYVWTRGSGTLGWRDTTVFDYNEEVNWGRIFGALSTAGDSMETYTFRILDPSDTTRAVGWFPIPPSGASIAFTAIGQPNTSGVTGESPSALSLSVRTWPNPARGKATFAISLPRQGWLRLDLMDPLGRHVRQVAASFLQAGRHEIEWDGRDDAGQLVSPGVYFIRAVSGDQSKSAQCVVIGHTR